MVSTIPLTRSLASDTQSQTVGTATIPGPPSSDNDRLADAVDQALRRTGFPYLRNVTVLVNGVIITLRGRVPSFYVKQLAQEAVRSVTAVRVIVNELEVVPSHRRAP